MSVRNFINYVCICSAMNLLELTLVVEYCNKYTSSVCSIRLGNFVYNGHTYLNFCDGTGTLVFRKWRSYCTTQLLPHCFIFFLLLYSMGGTAAISFSESQDHSNYEDVLEGVLCCVGGAFL